jgi:hypothetical protein
VSRLTEGQADLRRSTEGAAAASNAGKPIQPVVESRLKLPTPSWKSGTSGADRGPTTHSLARDAELSKLLDEFNEDGGDDLVRAQDSVNSRLGASTLQGENKLKKALAIPDYIRSSSGVGLVEEDDELVTRKGLTFKLQGRTKKIEVQNVTIPQWLSANILIFEILTPTLTVREIKDYLHYTRQVGDLLQVYTSATVFQLDHEHRQEVAREEHRWNEVSSHLERYYLERVRGSGGNAGTSTNGGGSGGTATSKSAKRRFNHPCARYNSKDGCDNVQCKFQPICSIKGCRGNHPKHLHPASSDGFRSIEPAPPVNG